jgi:ELWxxDGT repeat protein
VGAVNRVLAIGSHTIFFQTNVALWETEISEVVGAAIQPIMTLPQQPNFWIPEPTPMGSRAFFSLSDSAGTELWSTDGTTPGTQRMLDIAPGLLSSWPQWLTASTTRLFFSADDGVHGRELWSSDGTAEGTQMVVDLVPGPGSSLPDQLTVVDGLLLFAATDSVNGKELWVSNGTAAGTVMLQNIAPGAASSTPHEFTVGKDRVFFLANDTVHGFELWSMTRSALTLASPPAAAGFFTLTPCRIVDSRAEGGALASGTVRSLSTRGRCGVPDSARSLAVNVTTVSATSAGTLTLGSNDSQFASAALPIAAGITRATQFQLRLSPSGDGTFHLGAAVVGGGAVDFIVDVVGYFE